MDERERERGAKVKVECGRERGNETMRQIITRQGRLMGIEISEREGRETAWERGKMREGGKMGDK